LFARIRRFFSTEEVKSLAKQLDEAIERHSDWGHKLEGLAIKIERFENKERMATARAARVPARSRGELDPEEEAILRDLRNGEAEVVSTRGDPFNAG